MLAGIAVGAIAFTWILQGVVTRTPEGPHPPPDPLEGDYVQVVGRDGILPVYDPSFIEADRARLAPDELVIGVEIGGQARAYPVGFLNFREMVNDRIGPVPFLVTW